jgi:hypothetical protein
MKNNTIPSLPPLMKWKLTQVSRSLGTLLCMSLMAFTFTSCDDPCIGPVADICPPVDTTACQPTTAVTVENVGCGVGVWGSFWLRTDYGDLLQPWISNVTTPINPGERYLIAYGPAQRDHLYDSLVICMAVAPMGTPIRINCMQAESNPH